MKVLALDVATNCGVAVGSSGGDPKAWSVDLGKGRSEGSRLSQVLRLTDGLIKTHSPDFVAVEAPIGGKNANAYLIKLVGCVEGCCANRGVQCEIMHSGTIRKHFLGKAYTSRDFPHLKPAAAKKAIKSLVMDQCKRLKWMVEDDDSADACALWDYACATRARGYQSAPIGGLFRG